MSIVLELNRCTVELTCTFDIDEPRCCDQNIGYGGILQQWLERAEAEHFAENFLDNPVALKQTERRLFFVDEFGDGCSNFGSQAISRERGKHLQVDAAQQLSVQRKL